MEHLENDMDDLFQKAGELYPLKTTGSDWDAVAGKLQNPNPGEVHDLSGAATPRSSGKRWLLLLLLIPMGFAISYYSGKQNPVRQNGQSVKPAGGSADQNKKNIVPSGNLTAPVVLPDNNKTTASGHIDGKSVGGNKTENSSTNGTGSIKNNRLAYVSAGKTLSSNNALNAKKQLSPSSDKSQSDLSSNHSNGASQETEAGVANKTIDNNSSSATGSILKAEAAAVPVAVATRHEADAAVNKTDKTESSKKTAQDSSLTKKKINTDSKKSKGFYVGLFAGPDVSTVKFQSVKNVGLSLGALIGYRFNGRVSIETGLIWDKKYYYSNGEYYKKDGVALPPTTTLDGSCSMFEIPVNIRIDFATKKNHGFFAKTGLSSYLMTSEKYTFNYPAYPSFQWKNDSLQNNIFSILQISGGYERAISDKTKIRVEPYVKIPLQGIGKGDMPISSFGIYFGITHSFR
jgi:hypothetical protein